MEEVQIRIIDSSELDLLSDLWAALHEHHSGLAEMPPVRDVWEAWEIRKDTYRGWLAEGHTTLFVAESGGRACGYASVRIGERAATWQMGEKVAELETLAVLPDVRGAGVGTALVEAARAAAKEAGADTMLVSVAHSNDSALGFYGASGFQPFYVDLMIPTEGEG